MANATIWLFIPFHILKIYNQATLFCYAERWMINEKEIKQKNFAHFPCFFKSEFW